MMEQSQTEPINIKEGIKRIKKDFILILIVLIILLVSIYNIYQVGNYKQECNTYWKNEIEHSGYIKIDSQLPEPTPFTKDFKYIGGEQT